MPIRTPPAWGLEQISQRLQTQPGTARDYWPHAGQDTRITVRRIGLDDLRYALRRGFEDFGALRTDVAFLCIFYPIVGLLLARAAYGSDFLPLLFPLASGFALVGPVAAVGLNEMSRRRELGIETGWTSAFAVFRSPALGRILMLGAGMVMLFLAWIVCAETIYNMTLGPMQPVGLSQFANDVLHTRAGWMMTLIGCSVGFLFAVVAFSVSVVSFPMLLDRDVSLDTAVSTSLRAVATNPGVMAAWGLIIAATLVIASIPVLLGLIIALPVLGHATWHLYGRMVQS